MNHLPMDNAIWVAQPDSFNLMLEDLARQAFLGVDTESNSLFAYHEQVCLIQISTLEKDYLVDPLSLEDLSALETIFANPAIEKVFHAAEYDLICLKRDFKFTFQSIFDTMIASRILGRASVGLGAVLEAEFGIVLDKRYQRANWGARPLPPAQLAYARLDSHYLIDLRHRIKKDLETCGRWDLAQEDFVRMCDVEVPPENGNDSCWRISGGRDLSPRQLAVLQELCRFRDQNARNANQPAFKIIGNQSLLEIALGLPQTHNELYRLQVLSSRQWDRYAQGILEAVQRGFQSGPVNRPSMPRPDDRFLNRLDLLREWRKQAGRAMGVESDVILPRDILEDIAREAPEDLQRLSVLMSSVPQRFRLFGKDILRVVQLNR
jgi:ribonuclease D